MKIDRRRSFVALVGAAGLALTVGLAGCSSDSGDSAEAAAQTEVQGPGAVVAAPASPVRVGVQEFADVIASPGVTIVDVRTPEEYAQGHIEAAVNIPVEYPDFMDQVGQLDPNGTYAVYCRSGNRSGQAERALRAQGFVAVSNAGSLSGLLAATNTPSSQSGR